MCSCLRYNNIVILHVLLEMQNIHKQNNNLWPDNYEKKIDLDGDMEILVTFGLTSVEPLLLKNRNVPKGSNIASYLFTL